MIWTERLDDIVSSVAGGKKRMKRNVRMFLQNWSSASRPSSIPSHRMGLGY